MILKNAFFWMDIDSYLRTRMMKYSFIWLVSFFPVFMIGQGGRAIAQQKAIQYTRDFEFKDGVYFSISDFKKNNPLPKSKIIFNSNKDDKDFLKYVLDKPTFTYIDSLGKEQQMKTNNLWGYSSGGTLYVNHGRDFNRVTIIGKICHFVAIVPTRIGIGDPFYQNPGFGNSDLQYTYVSSQYIIDYESGNILDFDVEHMEPILQRDEQLFKDFSALKKKQKRDSVFLYLRKYNEKHPIYFPE